MRVNPSPGARDLSPTGALSSFVVCGVHMHIPIFAVRRGVRVGIRSTGQNNFLVILAYSQRLPIGPNP